MVDEADKAPTHVTCILKALVESGEMILGDGRRVFMGEFLCEGCRKSFEMLSRHDLPFAWAYVRLFIIILIAAVTL